MSLTEEQCLIILRGLSPRRQAQRLRTWEEQGAADAALIARLRSALPPEKIGVGDIVAAITEKLHIPHCGGCEGRRKTLNAVEVPNVLGLKPKSS